MRRLAATVVTLTALGWPAEAKDEPFGQETVEVRPFRQAPPRPAHGRTSHRHGEKAHAHARGGAVTKRGHAHDGHAHARVAKHSSETPDGPAHGLGGSHGHGIETEHLFGFTIGTDIGPPGDKHVVVTNDFAIGKRAGSYAAGSHVLEYAFTPWKDFHFGMSGGFASHAIVGVPGFDDRRQIAFDHVALEFRQRLLDRKTSPFGLALVVEPHWGRIDETSGARVDRTVVEFTLAADKEVIADRLFVAFNVFYAPEHTRSVATGEVERSSVAGVSFAAMHRMAATLFAGAELRYARAYDGLALERFTGEAVFLGPIVYANVAPSVALVAAWSAQVAGRTVDVVGPLDLDRFARHRARLKLVVDF